MIWGYTAWQTALWCESVCVEDRLSQVLGSPGAAWKRDVVRWSIHYLNSVGRSSAARVSWLGLPAGRIPRRDKNGGKKEKKERLKWRGYGLIIDWFPECCSLGNNNCGAAVGNSDSAVMITYRSAPRKSVYRFLSFLSFHFSFTTTKHLYYWLL